MSHHVSIKVIWPNSVSWPWISLCAFLSIMMRASPAHPKHVHFGDIEQWHFEDEPGMVEHRKCVSLNLEAEPEPWRAWWAKMYKGFMINVIQHEGNAPFLDMESEYINSQYGNVFHSLRQAFHRKLRKRNNSSCTSAWFKKRRVLFVWNPLAKDNHNEYDQLMINEPLGPETDEFIGPVHRRQFQPKRRFR